MRTDYLDFLQLSQPRLDTGKQENFVNDFVPISKSDSLESLTISMTQYLLQLCLCRLRDREKAMEREIVDMFPWKERKERERE